MKEDQEKTYHGKSWLQKVAEQSWEPELLISGLAIFATLQLPEYVREFHQYYQFNLQQDTGFVDELMPILVAGITVTALQALSIAFIFHFAVRAFWVGLVGLISVFPDGIKYEKLEYSDLYRKEMKQRLGNRDSFLLATDRLASTVFSIAFLFVMVLFGVGVIYLAFFLLINVMKLFISESAFDIYSITLLITAAIFLIGASVLSLVLNMKRIRKQEKYAKMHFKLTWYMGNVFYPIIYKPVQYLILTFMSNLKSNKFQIFGALLFLSFMLVFMANVFGLMNTKPFEPRDFYSERSLEAFYQPEFYVSETQTDYFRDPVLSKPEYQSGERAQVFIPYPKMLDIKLEKFCEQFETDEDITRFERRKQTNIQRIDCANRFFKFTINNSDTLQSDLKFTRHAQTNQAGYQSWLQLPDSLLSGEYQLNIVRPVLDDADAKRDSLGRLLRFEAEIPFWIE